MQEKGETSGHYSQALNHLKSKETDSSRRRMTATFAFVQHPKKFAAAYFSRDQIFGFVIAASASASAPA